MAGRSAENAPDKGPRPVGGPLIGDGAGNDAGDPVDAVNAIDAMDAMDAVGGEKARTRGKNPIRVAAVSYGRASM